MKRETKSLLDKSLDSVLLSIEHFNKHSNIGRHEAVLIFLDRAFELMLKSIILHKGGMIRGREDEQTIGFNQCVRKCVSDGQVKCMNENEALTVQIINSLRDAAQHYILECSEQQLYVYAQSALTLYNKLLQDIFNKKLTDFMPERVLPVSPNPPKEFTTLINVEFDMIKELVKTGKRRKLDAKSKLLSYAIIEASLNGKHSQPSDIELEKITDRIKNGDNWESIFPAINRLNINPEGKGFAISLKITKNEGTPVYVVPPDTPGATPMAIKRVNELEFYCFNLDKVAEKLNLTNPRATAVIRELKVQENKDYFKEVRLNKSSVFKRYSPLAVEHLLKQLPNLDVEMIWQKHKDSLSGQRRKK